MATDGRRARGGGAHWSKVHAEALLSGLPADAEALADVGPGPTVTVGHADGAEDVEVDFLKELSG